MSRTSGSVGKLTVKKSVRSTYSVHSCAKDDRVPQPESSSSSSTHGRKGTSRNGPARQAYTARRDDSCYHSRVSRQTKSDTIGAGGIGSDALTGSRTAVGQPIEGAWCAWLAVVDTILASGADSGARGAGAPACGTCDRGSKSAMSRFYSRTTEAEARRVGPTRWHPTAPTAPSRESRMRRASLRARACGGVGDALAVGAAPPHAVSASSSTLPVVRQLRAVAPTPSFLSTAAASLDRAMPSGAWR